MSTAFPRTGRSVRTFTATAARPHSADRTTRPRSGGAGRGERRRRPRGVARLHHERGRARELRAAAVPFEVLERAFRSVIVHQGDHDLGRRHGGSAAGLPRPRRSWSGDDEERDRDRGSPQGVPRSAVGTGWPRSTDLDLAIPEGGVFGFLGPNGSGKTTTIRCVLGLVRPPGAGSASSADRFRAGCTMRSRRVGAVVESPALFPTMTGRENLRLLGAVDASATTASRRCSVSSGSSERAGDLVTKYSLGMRQRLGLAAALLKDPELLILDEPANGLDPAGIRQVRCADAQARATKAEPSSCRVTSSPRSSTPATGSRS